MEPLLVSTAVVAIAEIGDKTQLLSFVLAARHRRPVPIVLGILVATLLNHALAGAVGVWVTRTIDPVWLRWGLGLAFIAMAAWALVPDRLDDDEAARSSRLGVFATTTLAFFLVEIGALPDPLFVVNVRASSTPVAATKRAVKHNTPRGLGVATTTVAEPAKKRARKGCDWIVANDVGASSSVMGGDKNKVHLVTATTSEAWPELDKSEVARRLVERIAQYFGKAA